jgi:hypothetical protein
VSCLPARKAWNFGNVLCLLSPNAVVRGSIPPTASINLVASRPLSAIVVWGKNAEHMPSGFESVAKFGIRIALPFISAVPYVESVVDDKLAAKISAYKATIGQDKKKEAFRDQSPLRRKRTEDVAIKVLQSVR